MSAQNKFLTNLIFGDLVGFLGDDELDKLVNVDLDMGKAIVG